MSFYSTKRLRNSICQESIKRRCRWLLSEQSGAQAIDFIKKPSEEVPDGRCSNKTVTQFNISRIHQKKSRWLLSNKTVSQFNLRIHQKKVQMVAVKARRYRNSIYQEPIRRSPDGCCQTKRLRNSFNQKSI